MSWHRWNGSFILTGGCESRRLPGRTRLFVKPSRAISPLIPDSTELEQPLALPPGLEDEYSRRRSKTEWLQLLWQRRSFLKRLMLRGIVAITVVAFLLPKRFESTTRIMPPDEGSSGGMGMLAALAGRASGGGESGSGMSVGSLPGFGMLANDLLGVQSTGATLVGILQSDTVRDRIIDRFNLQKVYWDHYKQDARKDLGKYTQISEDTKSGIITITVTDRDPKRSAAMAKAYVDELDRLVAQLSTSAAHRERVFIEQRMQAVKQELDVSARAFSQYASKNTAVDISAQAKAMVQSAAVLQGQLIAARSELQGLKQIYTDNNIRVRTVEARVAELQKQLEQMDVGTSETDDGSQSGDGNSQNLYPSIRKLPLLGVRWADLYRQTKIDETVFELLRQKYELARIQEAKEIPTIKVLDPAIVPEKKASPHRLILIFLGALALFAAGCAWIVTTVLWSEMDSQDPRKRLAQEVGSACRAGGEQFYQRTRRVVRGRVRNLHGNNNNNNGKPAA